MGQPKPHTRPLHVGSNSSTRHVKCFACGEPCREQFRNPYTSYTRASARARVQPRRFPRRPRTPSHFLCKVNNVVRYRTLSSLVLIPKIKVVWWACSKPSAIFSVSPSFSRPRINKLEMFTAQRSRLRRFLPRSCSRLPHFRRGTPHETVQHSPMIMPAAAALLCPRSQ